MSSLNGTDTSRREAGLAMLSTAVSERSAFPGYVFATLAVEDAIRFQYRWIRNYWETLGDLPLVGAFDHGYYRTAAAWDCLTNRQIILFGDYLTPAILRQAVRCDGKLIVRNYVRNRMQLAIRDPRFIVQEWIDKALPWREFLQRVMFELKTQDHLRKFTKLLIDARLSSAELGELFLGSLRQWQALHRLTPLPEFAPLIESLQQLRGVHCPCPLQERIWGKHKYPWITLRVEKKYLLSNGQVRWAGRVEDLKRQLYSFVVADGEIARGGLLKAVRRHLRAQHQQEPVFENRNWHFSDRELTLPHIEVIPNADRLGFVSPAPEQWVFRLPQYGVRHGQIELDQKVPLVLPDCPAQGLEPPPPLSKEVLEPLRRSTPPAELFWAIQQVLYQLITARCEFQVPQGVALTGAGSASVLAQIGRILDTPMHPTPGPRYWNHHLEQLTAKINAYDWPAVLSSKGRSPRTITRLLTELVPRQCLVDIPRRMADTALQRGWLTLDVADTVSLPDAWEPLARQVLLNLLHQHQPGQFGKAQKFPWQIRARELLSERLAIWGDFRTVLRQAGKHLQLPTDHARQSD